MFIITTRKQFSEAARRLANAFTVKTALNMVTRALNENKLGALADTLNLALEDKSLDERMGLPQANDLLSLSLSGEEQNVTSSKIKQNKSIANTPTKAMTSRVQTHAEHLKSLGFTLGNQADFIQDIQKAFEEVAAARRVGLRDTIPAEHDDSNNSQDLLGFILHMLKNEKVRYVETDGMTSFKLSSHGVCEYSKHILIAFETNTLSMHFDWKESEYETDGVDISVYVNGIDMDDYLPGKDENGAYSCDEFMSFMEEIHTKEFVQAELDSDFVDVTLRHNQKLLPVAEYLANLEH